MSITSELAFDTNMMKGKPIKDDLELSIASQLNPQSKIKIKLLVTFAFSSSFKQLKAFEIFCAIVGID